MTDHEVRRRPRWLRALGNHEPPTEVEINAATYRWERTIKHDSWAATAIYVAADPSLNALLQNGAHRIVCKFNRVQPLGFLPCRWLGRWLAKREARMYARLEGIPGIVRAYDQISAAGQKLPHAVAHDYIAGHPLRWQDQPDPSFFVTLHRILQSIHERQVAYVDLNKWENVIVDEAGEPHLIDFQISLYLPLVWPLSSILRVLQCSDLYHLSKHAHRICPQSFDPDHFGRRPWWIRLHRKIAEPFRAARRWLLVRLGVRDKHGKPQSEAFVEEGLRAFGTTDSPIEQLYRLLISPAYADDVVKRGCDFMSALFDDLIGRLPVNEKERQYADMLSTRTRHDQIIWMLKSELFLAQSNQWSEADLDQTAQRIQRQIESFRAGTAISRLQARAS
ncbi:MAG TPA: hypothetical protein PKD54_13990 [Pirellulaceae bacterium]|nr:hypothetical protein [Pirellulaceae bacterium]